MLRDRIQKQVYPQRRNTATILNYLEELVLISAKEVGLVPIGAEDNGYQDVPLPFEEVVILEVPEQAVSATIMVEGMVGIDDSDSGDDSIPTLLSSMSKTITTPNRNSEQNKNSTLVLRFKENGDAPELDSGFGLGNNDIYELVGSENLSNFKVMGIVPENTPMLRIQFYQTAQFVK